jgi:hypothetical protein
MKKHVRAILNDLKQQPAKKTSQDLQNQTLSKDPRQKVRQLDYQAQQDTEQLSN